MRPDSSARKVINRENSLTCPNLTPTSIETLFCSPACRSKAVNTTGLIMMTAHAKSTAGHRISCNAARLNPAPREKKNIIRKKSRNGFNRSVINMAIGLDASVTPAMKAPIS